jgi:hypothetical protein
MVKSSSASLNSQKMLYFRLLLMEMGEASIKKKERRHHRYIITNLLA